MLPFFYNHGRAQATNERAADLPMDHGESCFYAS
jgi:hypothetical protein